MSETIKETASVLSVGIESFLTHMQETLDETQKGRIESFIHDVHGKGIPKALAHRLGILKVVSSSPDIILIASDCARTVPQVAELYFKVGGKYHFSTLRDILDSQAFGKSQWERRLASAMNEDLYRYQSDLVTNMLSHANDERIQLDDGFENLMNTWQEKNKNVLQSLQQTIKESHLETNPDLTVMGVVLKDLRQFCGTD